ncbi:MAG: hypothetical protein N3D17_06330, partial [bacterium]|nr:hypothetical protein [bacterium]
PTTIYKGPDEINAIVDGKDWTPPEMQNKYIVRRYDFWYDGSNNFLSDCTAPDSAMMHRIDIYVLKKKDKSIIARDSVIVSRDGIQ